ncbi:MAG: hypothetical protein RBT49_03230 [Bacteroidales bacterium]|jgi:hypothetical protein|nr:hypothetical protein [Bacteroidales bacterium]
MNMNAIKEVGIIITILLLISCTSEREKHLTMVKEGVLDGYPTVKVGNLLENQPNLLKVEWDYKTTNQGASIVTYKGYAKLDENKILNKLWNIYTLIEFHFLANDDRFFLDNLNIVFERRSSDNDELFDLFMKKKDHITFFPNDNLKTVMIPISEYPNTSYLDKIEKSMVEDGIVNAILTLKPENLKFLEWNKHDVSNLYTDFGKNSYLHKYHFPIDYLLKVMWREECIKYEDRMYYLKDLEKSKVIYDFANILVNKGIKKMSSSYRSDILMFLTEDINFNRYEQCMITMSQFEEVDDKLKLKMETKDRFLEYYDLVDRKFESEEVLTKLIKFYLKDPVSDGFEVIATAVPEKRINEIIKTIKSTFKKTPFNDEESEFLSKMLELIKKTEISYDH